MPNIKGIKNRISSVNDTRKITNAMYLIASTKMRKSKVELDRTRPYFEAVKAEMKRIFRIEEQIDSRYMYPQNRVEASLRTYAILVITADKGLAGSYNKNIIREALLLKNEHPDSRLYVVGGYGRRYFKKHGIPIVEDFDFDATAPTMQRATQIRDILLSEFDSGNVSKIFVVYTDFINTMTADACSTRILPFHRKDFTFFRDRGEKEVKIPFEFYPSPAKVLDSIVPQYLSGFIYSALTDSFCCEQNSRMNAMDSANRNSDELISELQTLQNHQRQTLITQEISEVSSGALAMKKKNKV